MATYEEIHGKRVDVFDDDPTLDSSYEGQVWYNSATGTLKTVISFGSWNSEVNCSETSRGRASAGTFPACVYVGGFPGSFPITTQSEEFNGFTFSNGGSTGSAHYVAGMDGTQTAAIICTGYNNPPGARTPDCETYDGSSFSQVADVNTARYSLAASGTTTACLIYGGNDQSSPLEQTAKTESFNGSSWSEVADLNQKRECFSTGAGTATAAIVAGGTTYPPTTKLDNTEFYDGTSWSEQNTMNTARNGGGGWGSQTAMVVGGGSTPSVTGATESWDGTSWSTEPGTLATARTVVSAVGSDSTEGFISGGYNGSSNINSSERFNKSINVITRAAWASGGTYPSNIYGAAGAGNTPAGLLFGGYDGSSGVTTTSEYDGSTWTGSGGLPVGKRYLAGFGTQTAALAAKGRTSSGSPTDSNTSEEYDGSSWTAGGTASVRAILTAGSGTQTSGLVFGGTPPYLNSTEEYDGSSWTAGGAMGTARANHSGSVGGTQTAALAFFGDDGSTPLTLNVEEYNGTSWSEQNNVPAGRFAGGGAGTQTAGYGFGGYTAPGTPNQTTSTIKYDGTSWSAHTNMSTARGYNSGSAGTGPAGIFTVGDFPAANSTEQLTEETETVTAQTLTTG